MILTCPSCSSRYMVNAKAIGEAGRKVRCASCSHVWHEKPKEEQIKASEATEPIPESVKPVPDGAALPAIDAPATNGAHGSFLFVCFAFFLVVFSALAISNYKAITDRWMPSVRLFAMIGLDVPVPGAGFTLENARAYERKDTQAHIVYVEARVGNTTDHDMLLPPMDVTLTGADNKTSAHHFEVPGKVIGAGQTVPFRIAIDNPPIDGQDVSVTFAKSKKTAQHKAIKEDHEDG